MALSIRNEHAEKLAREIARQTGESITRTLIVSLEERLERLKGTKRSADIYQKIKSIAKRCSSLPDIDKRSADEILGYDDNGV